MSRGPDSATLLERALVASAGFPLTVADATMTRWASVTFTGARHVLTLSGERSATADAWLAGLADADLPLRGHLVADVIVTRVTRDEARFTAVIEVLTVEDR